MSYYTQEYFSRAYIQMFNQLSQRHISSCLQDTSKLLSKKVKIIHTPSRMTVPASHKNLRLSDHLVFDNWMGTKWYCFALIDISPIINEVGHLFIFLQKALIYTSMNYFYALPDVFTGLFGFYHLQSSPYLHTHILDINPLLVKSSCKSLICLLALFLVFLVIQKS